MSPPLKAYRNPINLPADGVRRISAGEVPNVTVAHGHRPCCLYVICEVQHDDELRPSKIGITNLPYERLTSIQAGNPRKVRMCAIYQCGSRKRALQVEADVMAALAKKHIRGEWFDVPPSEMISVIDALARGDADGVDKI